MKGSWNGSGTGSQGISLRSFKGFNISGNTFNALRPVSKVAPGKTMAAAYQTAITGTVAAR